MPRLQECGGNPCESGTTVELTNVENPTVGTIVRTRFLAGTENIVIQGYNDHRVEQKHGHVQTLQVKLMANAIGAHAQLKQMTPVCFTSKKQGLIAPSSREIEHCAGFAEVSDAALTREVLTCDRYQVTLHKRQGGRLRFLAASSFWLLDLGKQRPST